MASAPILAAARLGRCKMASAAASSAAGPALALFVTRRCLSSVAASPALALAEAAVLEPEPSAAPPRASQAPRQAQPRRKQLQPAARNILLNLRGLKRRQTTRFGPPKPSLAGGGGSTVSLGRAFGGRPPNGAPVSSRGAANGASLVNGHGGRGANANGASLVQGGGSAGRGAAAPSLLQGRPSPGLAQGRPRPAASLIQGPPKPQLGLVNGYSAGRQQVNGHRVNGHQANGHHVNGHQVNGHQANGHGSGKPLNGQTVGKAAAGVNGYDLNGVGSAYTTSLEDHDDEDCDNGGIPEPRAYESDLVVVLDMDECLIHSQFLSHQQSSCQLSAPDDKYRQAEAGRPAGSPAFNADEEAESIISSNCEYFRINLPDGDLVHVNKRPQLDDFLRDVCSRFETHVFTAAVDMYADPLLDRLDPDGGLFGRRRLFRESCTLDCDLGAYVKDLHAILGGREPWGRGAGSVHEPTAARVNGHGGPVNGSSDGLDDDKREELFAKYNEGRVVLVDNNPLSFLAQPSNGILVSNFYDDPKDATLEAVSELLDELDSAGDVRPVLDERFGLAEALGDVLKYSGGGWR